MKAHYRRRINASALLCALVSGCFVRPVSSEEAKESAPKEAAPVVEKSPGELLFLELRHSSKPGDPPVQIFITNKGEGKVTLVEPGYGSFVKVRSSQIAWTIFKVQKDKSLIEVKPYYQPGCGNANKEFPSNILELAPGQSHEFKNWTYTPKFEEPGTYRVRFYYDNVPSKIWTGDLSPKLIQQVRQSTQCELITDELEFTIPELASDKK